MASVSGNIKGFYRQKKTNTNNKSSKSNSSKKPPPSTTFASDVVSHAVSPTLQGDYSESEMMLRQFDMNMVYGPCIGMTRLERWERAQKLGLNPPQEIERLLKSGKVQMQSLWDGHI